MPGVKTEQINFRVSPGFRRRIESESIKRDMSLQDLLTTALKFYFQTPPEDWKTAEYVAVSYSDDDEGSEESAWVQLWVKYMNAMPEEKSRLMADVMKLDLLHYRSSRRKAALRKRRKVSCQEESNVEARTK